MQWILTLTIHSWVYLHLTEVSQAPRRSSVKTPSSRQSLWWEQPSPDSPVWWCTTWGLRCVGPNFNVMCEHKKCSLRNKIKTYWIQGAGKTRERDKEIDTQKHVQFLYVLLLLLLWIFSLVSSLKLTYIVGKNISQSENWNQEKIHLDHMQVNLKKATSHFENIKKLWVNLNQVDSKLETIPQQRIFTRIVENRNTSVNANWTKKRACFRQLIFLYSKPNTHKHHTPYTRINP